MSLFNLSSVKNRPRRSGFDLSSKVAFTAKVGELLPVKWTLTMPSDVFSLKEQHFTRTQPVNTSAYTYGFFYEYRELCRTVRIPRSRKYKDGYAHNVHSHKYYMYP